LKAPLPLIEKVALVLAARRQVERELQEEEERKQRAAERDIRLRQELYGI
jgi:hypothetical protein